MVRRTIRRAAAVLCALLALTAGPAAQAAGGSAPEAEEVPVLSGAAERALRRTEMPLGRELDGGLDAVPAGD